jgi:septum formation inhibitor-activating ATPase MinD
LISLGCSVRDAGRILGISDSTVDNHKTKAMARLGIKKVTLLTRYAISSRIAPLGDCLSADELALLRWRDGQQGLKVPR